MIKQHPHTDFVQSESEITSCVWSIIEDASDLIKKLKCTGRTCNKIGHRGFITRILV